MKIAVIAEYNPFHNGHILQLNYLKKNYPNTQIIIFLSGDFVQRGELPVASFEDRKSIALQYGADEVVKLNNFQVLQAAKYFAFNIIKTFKDHQITHICFGSESNDLEKLIYLANKKEKTNNFKLMVRNNQSDDDYELASNDILGVEYLRAIKKMNYDITPILIKRTGSYSQSHIDENSMTSASQIRKMFYESESVEKVTPLWNKLIDNRKSLDQIYYLFQSKIINHKIEYFENLINFENHKFNLFKKHIYQNTLDKFLKNVSNKNLSKSNIKRTIITTILGIKHE